MKTIIAIFLILKAVSNSLKLPQRGDKNQSEFIGHVVVESVMLILHLWFGIWILTNII